jgi:5-methylthioadenosine/S-adenosylhomocysteine deaminase
MPVVPADFRIEVRWIAPMTARNELLVEHSLLVRDGRILDILPNSIAAQRYAATVVLQRPSHCLMPGLINTHADAALSLLRGANTAAILRGRSITAELAHDGTLLAIAEMLKSGITCFSDRYYFPEETARVAAAQGMRAVLGMPIAENATPWAGNAAQSLTRALELRDQYGGHPLISTAFAPLAAIDISDATFARLATLADELDAGIMVDVHRGADELSESLARHGLRPIERLWKLGLLTPALNAVHMAHSSAADTDLAQRTGISISLCLQSNLKKDGIPAPVSQFAAAGIRMGLATAGLASMSHDLWDELRLLALLSNEWDALAAATRGGAAVLGLENDVGTLQAGKWADLCCVDLSGPATQPVNDPLAQLSLRGIRDMVSDVWVAGRQLVSDGELTRLDWNEVAARCSTWSTRMSTEG